MGNRKCLSSPASVEHRFDIENDKGVRVAAIEPPANGIARNEGNRCYPRVEIAVRIPCNTAVGGGGHPGTVTSTGITLETPPQEA